MLAGLGEVMHQRKSSGAKFFYMFLSRLFRYHLMHGRMRYLMEGSFYLHLFEEIRSMSFEMLNPVIAVSFMTAWILIGQFSFVKH